MQDLAGTCTGTVTWRDTRGGRGSFSETVVVESTRDGSRASGAIVGLGAHSSATALDPLGAQQEERSLLRHVYCLEWYEDDEVLGMKEDGFSLHRVRKHAEAYAANHRSYHFVPDPQGAYLVSVPRTLYWQVWLSSGGIRRSHPREPDFPRV